jgi:glutamine amidotransferase
LTALTIGLVDYGMGNHASVVNALHDIGFRVRLSDSLDVLNETDVLLLPGVGAFPRAMDQLHSRGLVEFLRDWARRQKPMIGICLGMQLLASASYEHTYTAGLDLIPGEITSLIDSKWHIGWNTIECLNQNQMFLPSDAQAFYFNHSFSYHGPEKYQVAISRNPRPIVSAIKRGNVIGLQFHPEKSQFAGRELLKNIINGLCRA